MGPIREDNVRMFVDGKEISPKIQEVSYDAIRPEPVVGTFKKSFTGTASFEFTDAILNALLGKDKWEPSLDLEVTHILKPLPRKPKSKKKRIQKKWKKRYYASTASCTYTNVFITSEDYSDDRIMF